MFYTEVNCSYLKGSVSQDFQPPFFYNSNPSRPLINRLKYFRIQFQFPRDIRIFKKLWGVHPSAESSSDVCILPCSQGLRCASHRRLKLCSVLPTGESSCTVGFPPRSQALRCASHRRVKLYTVESKLKSL